MSGTEDRLPGQWGHWRALHAAAVRLFGLYGYGQMETPIIEDTRLFVKGTGETTDIVEKQMYTMETGDGESITLRPEGTPSAVRAYLSESLHKQQPFQKFWYHGPMFRRERPQRGRLREFHQIGVEAIGSSSPLLDAEVLFLAVDIYREVGLTDLRVCVNSIGCPCCRPAYREELRRLLDSRRADLCEDCRNRLDRNVLRLLDCKNEQCNEITASLPAVSDYLCDECREHDKELRRTLAAGGLPVEEDTRLVRGLDYYTRTVFEVRHGGLGARDAICGGGRYDGLVEQLGGPSMPCVGFAMGVEASVLAMEAQLGPPLDSSARPDVFIVCFDESARRECLGLAQALRAAGVAADMDFEGRSAKAQMRAANRVGSRCCLLIGEREIEARHVLIKDMATGEQWTAAWGEAPSEIARVLSGDA